MGSIVATDGFVQLNTAEYAVLADDVPDISKDPFVVAVHHHTFADVASRDHLRIIGRLNDRDFGLCAHNKRRHSISSDKSHPVNFRYPC